MTCWALVPIKARTECKARLRNDLDPAARRALARAMLAHVVEQASRSRNVTRVIVVSPERDVLPRDISLVIDQGRDLNAAIRLGRDHALSQGAGALLVLAADLPTVTATEIDTFVARGRRSHIAIAPDRAGTGTNALYVENPRDFEFCFGANSRLRHQREARRHGIAPAHCSLPGLADDLDTSRDLERWLWVGGQSMRQAIAEVNA